MGVNEDIRRIDQRLDALVVSTGTASASVSLANGEQAVFTITTTADSGVKVLTAADVSLYVGSVAAANQLPGGSAIDESQWQFTSPWNDWGATNNINHKTLVYVRNISAGTKTVLIRTISRLVINSRTIGAGLEA